MTSRAHAKRRNRWRLTLLVLLSLVFQQLVLVSYVCAKSDVAVASASIQAHCQGMPQQAQQDLNPQVCVQHCAQQVPARPDAQSHAFSPLTAVPLPSAPFVARVSLAAQAVNVRARPFRIGVLSPEMRFRVLLI